MLVELVSKKLAGPPLFLAVMTMTLMCATAGMGSAATGAIFLPSPSNAENVTIALGSAGSVHAAFNSLDPANPGAYYTFCASDCGNRANWQGVVVGATGFFGGNVRLALTPEGHPRMMWLRGTGIGSEPNTYEYAECNVGCTNAANWTKGSVATRVFGSYSAHTRYFALDSLGRPRFLYNDGAVGGGTFYFSCDASCTVAANWQNTRISTANLDLYSLVFDAQSRPRLAYADLNALPGHVGYAACDSGCTSGANWTTTPLYVLGSGSALSLRLDSGGRPRLAFYEGSLGSGQTGDELLAYSWCDSGCTQASNWKSLFPGFAQFHGKGVDLIIDANDRPRVAYYADTSPFGVVYAQCTANCESVSVTPTWDGEFVETSDQLQASDPVAKKPGCSLSVWFPGEKPSLLLDAAGRPLFGYNARHTQGGGCTAHDDIKLLRFLNATAPTPPTPPALTITDVTVQEGQSGSTAAVFTVSLSAASGQTVTVQYATASGTATQGTDFTAASGSLSFNPGVLTANVSVSVNGDTTAEPDENYSVVLSAPSNATISKATGVGTISDDDGAAAGPRLSIDDRAVVEGTNASFRVTLSAASSQTVTVQYATASGSAVSPGDYVATSGALTFSPGRTWHSFLVPILADAASEGSESFYVNLGSPTNATLARGQATGTIGDPPAPANVPMYRAYNPNAVYHFFTTSQGEFLTAVAAGYRDESSPPCCAIPFRVPNLQGSGKGAIFRMYNPNNGRHYYTASAGERDGLMGIGWVYEKDEGFIYAAAGTPGTVEVFKLYNSNSGVHLYTVRPEEKDAILAQFPGIWFQHTSLGFAVP